MQPTACKIGLASGCAKVLALTSETAIAVVFLVMNLAKWHQSFLFSLIFVFHSRLQGKFEQLSHRLNRDHLGYSAAGWF